MDINYNKTKNYLNIDTRIHIFLILKIGIFVPTSRTVAFVLTVVYLLQIVYLALRETLF